MKTLHIHFIISLMMAMVAPSALAGNLSIPNEFLSGNKAKASEVNANFNAVENEVNDNDARIAALEAKIGAMQTTIANLQAALANKADIGHNHNGVYAPISHSHSQTDISGLTTAISTHSSQISAINNSEIMSLDPYVNVSNDSRGPIATFSGLNLKLVNGTGSTTTPNGLGNLIIGYDLNRVDATYFCSNGLYQNQTDCENNGDTWAVSHKTGSHYLVLGIRNNYSQFGGMVAGVNNTSNRGYSSILGGYNNTASHYYAVVSGGRNNTASGNYASVSGGNSNTASGYAASISGGNSNLASGSYASVSGGNSNTASGGYASVSAGITNTASADFSSVSGGALNIAGGIRASVSGGYLNAANGTRSTVSGGSSRTISGDSDWAAGSLFEDY